MLAEARTPPAPPRSAFAHLPTVGWTHSPLPVRPPGGSLNTPRPTPLRVRPPPCGRQGSLSAPVRPPRGAPLNIPRPTLGRRSPHSLRSTGLTPPSRAPPRGLPMYAQIPRVRLAVIMRLSRLTRALREPSMHIYSRNRLLS